MKHKRGFTMIEMTITIAISAILMTGLGLAVQTQLKAAVDNRNYLIALNLAKRQMAMMNNSTYPSVAGEAALSADSGFPNFIPTQEVVELASNGGKSLREIRIRVRHGSLAGPVLILLYTYRSDLLTFGNGL